MNHSLVPRVRHLPETAKRRDAVGRASGQSPFLSDPEAKFCCGKRGQRQNQQERSSMPIRPLSALVAKTAHSLTSACAPPLSAPPHGVAGASHKPRSANSNNDVGLWAKSDDQQSKVEEQMLSNGSVTFSDEIFGNIPE
jgi:hypothetical protein